MDPAVAAVLVVDVDALLAMSEEDGWEFDGAFALDGLERVGVKCIRRDLPKNCCAKKQKV